MSKCNNRFATIDLGTNTVNLLIADKENEQIVPIFENHQIICLGEGIAKTKNIAHSAIRRCWIAFEFITSKLKEYKVNKVLCTATSALRDAKNGFKIKENLENFFNIPIQIISGVEEAELVFFSTKKEFDLTRDRVVIFDIGGGSTEVTVLKNGFKKYQKSLNIGTVKGTERFIHSDPPKKQEFNKLVTNINNNLAKLKKFKIDTGIGIAGTITSLSAIINRIEPYDSNKIHQSTLTIEKIINCRKMLMAENLMSRKKIKGLDPERAKVIPAGALIAERVIETFGLKKIYVSDKGLRWGLMYKLMDS